MANISLGNTLTTGLVFTSDTTGNLVVTSTGGYVDVSSVTGGIALPVGNTAQRPGTAANGTLRYNITTSSVEGYVAGAWGAIGGSSGGGLTWANTVQTGNFTASSGNAYFVNTTSAAIYATLPSSPSLGNIVTFVDYAQTFGTYNLVINPNGSKINGNTSNITLATTGEAVGLVYADSTRGWVAYDGFVNNPTGIYSIDYLLLAGGGGGAAGYGGGGGGGGGAVVATTTVVPGTAYSIVLGAGGTGYPGYNTGGWTANHGANGTPSTGFTATATGGGGGGGGGNTSGYPGGSGGGGGDSSPGGSGTAGQGNTGGAGVSGTNYGAGGGGGAGGPGSNGSQPAGGPGGPGINWQSLGTYYGGGGGGGTYNGGTGGSGGTGNSGGYGSNGAPTAGSATNNSGGGGGGGAGYAGGGGPNASGGAGTGGSGICIVRYVGGQRGTGGTITSSGGYTYHTFNSSGTFTA